MIHLMNIPTKGKENSIYHKPLPQPKENHITLHIFTKLLPKNMKHYPPTTTKIKVNNTSEDKSSKKKILLQAKRRTHNKANLPQSYTKR